MFSSPIKYWFSGTLRCWLGCFPELIQIDSQTHSCARLFGWNDWPKFQLLMAHAPYVVEFVFWNSRGSFQCIADSWRDHPGFLSGLLEYLDPKNTLKVYFYFIVILKWGNFLRRRRRRRKDVIFWGNLGNDVFLGENGFSVINSVTSQRKTNRTGRAAFGRQKEKKYIILNRCGSDATGSAVKEDCSDGRIDLSWASRTRMKLGWRAKRLEKWKKGREQERGLRGEVQGRTGEGK